MGSTPIWSTCSEVEYDTLGRWVDRLNDQASDGPKERLDFARSEVPNKRGVWITV